MTREEKIFIFPSSKVPGHANPGMWIVASPLKPVSRGQRIVWEVVGEIAKLKLQLPDIFEPVQRLNDHIASARIKHDADSGMFFYDAYVNGQLAVGGSSPGVIIDP